MAGLEKRNAQRVSCEIPLGMPCTGSKWLARAVDISCTGLRILVPPAAFGLDSDVTLLDVARHLAGVLPRHTSVQIDPSRLGSLVERPIEVVRIGLCRDTEPQVELGCRLEMPLTREDLAAVGVHVPVPEKPNPASKRPFDRSTDRVASPGPTIPDKWPVDARSSAVRSADTPNRRLQALLIPTNGGGTEPLHVWTHTLTHERVELLVQDMSVLGLGEDIDGLSDLLLPILQRLGEECRLRVAKAATHIWSGPVRLQAVERLPDDPRALILDMTFGRPLRGPELRALKEV